MDETAPSYLYKETRLNLESASPRSTVILRLPLYGPTISNSRASQKRAHPTDVPPTEDESAFKQKHLASAASVYYRKYHKSPRSFLWRILEDGKVLALSVVDLCKQEKSADASLTLRLHFPSPIRQSCVALSDSKEHDMLSVFVMTESNHLYTLSLRPDFFKRRASTEDNVADWAKIYSPSAFSIKHSHRLVALSTEQLLLAVHDGGLLRFDRKPGEDSSSWKETHYSEGGWGHNLRNLIPFQGSHTVKYGNVNFEISAVISVAAPATTIDDVPYTFTVSLDHRIRVWNLENGKVVFTGDMLDQDRLPNEIHKYLIRPSQSNLIKTYEFGGHIFVVTFSPLGAGQFKIWLVNLETDGSMQLVDRFPNIKLTPPPPTADVWTLADFLAVFDNEQPDLLTLWLLWKNNTSYRVLKVDISSMSEARTSGAWKSSWIAVAGETLADSPLPVLLPTEGAKLSQKWLEYMIYPGRFTTPTLETALSIYGWGRRGSIKSLAPRSTNLAERMHAIVTSATTLTRISGKLVEQDQSGTVTDTQWRRFYRLVLELDKQRGEALSLSFDEEYDLASVVTADGLSLIRDCSFMERLWHNADEYTKGPAHRVTSMIAAAATFRESFSDPLLNSCHAFLQAELFEDPSDTYIARLHLFYEKCNFAAQIVDDDYNQLMANMGGSLKDLNQETYEALFGAMTSADDLDTKLQRTPLAAFGKKAFVRGVQETVELHRMVCFDQLVLLAFIEGEVDPEDEGLHLDIAPVYGQLVETLKRLELIGWLSKTQISAPPIRSERTPSFAARDLPSSPSKNVDQPKTITVLEGVLGHLLSLISDSGESAAKLLTDELLGLCDPATSSDYDLVPAVIQCFLLVQDRPDLAVEFSRFCTKDPFPTYIQGRARLAAKDAPSAASYFKKAAFGLANSTSKETDGRHSAGFLDDTEWNLLNAGLPKYYSHIVALFDKLKAYQFVIEFSRLGLQFASAVSSDAATTQIRTELLSRLFNAALQSMRYDIAHSSLVLFTDHAMQHSSLRSMIFRMCDTGHASQLIDLPFIGLQDSVDQILATKCLGMVDVDISAPYHKILYAWRIKRNDFRGAAAVSLERLQRLQQAGAGDRLFNSQRQRRDGGQDALETPVTRQYLALINALSCVDPKQAWILSEPLPKNGVASLGKRKVVTLEDVRKGYQEELDRIAAIENGQFAFIGNDGDEMEVL